MANKTWIAVDIKLGHLSLEKIGDDLHIQRVYTFLDDERNCLPVGTHKLVRSKDWDSLPSNIKSALQAIDAWTRSEILTEEGMSE